MDNEFWKTAVYCETHCAQEDVIRGITVPSNISALFMEHAANIKICLATKL